MRKLLAWCLALWPLAPAADPAGPFDYYVLALSWSPNWCALEGDRRGSEQCDAGTGHGWILHGLWPQFERGYPEYCQTGARAPTRRMTAGMADIMGTSGLAWHQWKKHGSCAGLSAADYYETARRAYEAIRRPPALRRLTAEVRIDPAVVEAAFLEANPALSPETITVTCKAGRIQEARICLTKSLVPRACGPDVRRDCTVPALLAPLR